MANQSVGNLYVQLSVNNSQLQSGLNQAGSLIQQFNKQTINIREGGLGGSGGFGFWDAAKWSVGISSIHEAIHLVRQFTAESYKMQVAYEKAFIAFESVTGSPAAAQKLLDQIQNFSLNSSMDMQGGLQFTRQILGAGIPAEEAVSTLRALSDVAAGTGGELSLIVKAYTQVMQKGRLQAEELNQQFAEQGLGASTIAQALNIPVDQFIKKVNEGRVSADEMRQALINMTKEGGKFANLSAKVADVDPFEKMSKNITETGRQLADALLKLTGFRDGLRELNRDWARFNADIGKEGGTKRWAKGIVDDLSATNFVNISEMLSGVYGGIGDATGLQSAKEAAAIWQDLADKEAMAYSARVRNRQNARQDPFIPPLQSKPVPLYIIPPDVKAFAEEMAKTQPKKFALFEGGTFEAVGRGAFSDFRTALREMQQARINIATNPKLGSVQDVEVNGRLAEMFLALEKSLPEVSNRASAIEVGSQASYEMMSRLEAEQARGGNIQERIQKVLEETKKIEEDNLKTQRQIAEILKNTKLSPVNLPK